MRRTRRRRPLWPWSIAVAAAMAGPSLWLARARGGERYDYVIYGASIVDGSGGRPYTGGIGVTGDRIAAVWRGTPLLPPHATVRAIDAHGLMLTPGFIDTHTHVDLGLGGGTSPIRADNFVEQGVTTVI